MLEKTDDPTTVTVKSHGLICPRCHSDERLLVSAIALLPVGDTPSEMAPEKPIWGYLSPCRCEGCGFEGPSRAFGGWGREGDVIDFTMWPDESTESVFEIEVYPMAVDREGTVTGAKGSHTLAESLGAEPEYWDVHLRRRTMCAGGRVDVLIEVDHRPDEASVKGTIELMQLNYPFAEVVE